MLDICRICHHHFCIITDDNCMCEMCRPIRPGDPCIMQHYFTAEDEMVLQMYHDYDKLYLADKMNRLNDLIIRDREDGLPWHLAIKEYNDGH